MTNDRKLKDISWLEFSTLSPGERVPYFESKGRLLHALVSQQFDRPFLDRICQLATRVRLIGKTRGGMMFLQQLLREKRAMLYFAQPSTRTFLSFLSACQIVGMDTGEVRDTSTSSELKGESPEDTVRTFSSYFDVIIMRHPLGGFADRIAWLLSNTDRPVPVINAGSGQDQHPTQALLDIYTLERSFEQRGGIGGKRVAFVGDLRRGRTVRSLAYLLTRYADTFCYFVAPAPLNIGDDILAALDRYGTGYALGEELDPILPEIDALYMTRIQDEWDVGIESRSIDVSAYALDGERMKRMKPDAVVLHPLPRRTEVALEVDLDPRAMYWRQVRNGMWVRAALLLHMFERDSEVDRYFADLTR